MERPRISQRDRAPAIHEFLKAYLLDACGGML